MTLEEAKRLSSDEINKAIAEASGWTWKDSFEQSFSEPRKLIASKRWFAPKSDYPQRTVPDFFRDLNACNQVSKDFTGHIWVRYAEVMAAIFCGEVKDSEIDWNDWASSLIDAPANIRAIALAVALSERKK